MTKKDKREIDLIYNKLLDFCEENQKNISTQNMCVAMSMFVSNLTYDLAPSSSHATHLLLSFMQNKLETMMEARNE